MKKRNKKKKAKVLTPKRIRIEVSNRTKKYEGHNFLEEYAMYIGTCQLLEFSLKKLLEEKHGIDLKKSKKWTLGRTKNELEKKKVRNDFTSLLGHIVESRNYIAHELISDELILKSMFPESIPKNHYSKNHRFLHKAIFELEELAVVFDWLNKEDAW